MDIPLKKTQHNDTELEQSVYACLAYFDIFKHPLTAEEILDFSSRKSTAGDIKMRLDTLLTQGIIVENQGYYSINESKLNPTQRIANEARASAAMDDARRYGKKIGSFPFVQAVSISGSMSKGVLHQDGDYDFFLIIKRKRIWLAKFLLKLYKVVFLGNSYEYFCINYLISDEKLEIEEKNLFTATELMTVIPVVGKQQLFADLHAANAWVSDYLPNRQWRQYEESLPTKTGISKLTQTLTDNRLGDFIDKMIMSYTIYRNRAKYEGLVDSSLFDIAFKSTADVAKVHPNNTQQYVLRSHKEKKAKYQCRS